MKLYYYTSDNGDGSSSVLWCTEEHITELESRMNDEDNPNWDQDLYANEGSASYITLPDGFDLDSLGITKWQFFNPKE